MAVLGRLLVSSAERLDLPDLLSLDSYASGDWKYFLKGLVGDTKPYILKGFDIIDPGNAIGTQSCSIRVADSITFYPGSNSGSFFHGLQDGHPQAAPLVPELRKNAVNYVYLTFSTFNTSVDTRAFWDPDKDGGVGGEFTQDINTESVLKVDVNVSTGSFPANTIPIAKITVGPVVITAIEDARDMMFRLGSGGINTNPFNTYAWRSLPGGGFARQEPPTQMLAGGINPFQGADKNILSLKEWMDAVMSKLRELGGTTYWYDDTSSFSIVGGFYDALATAFKSKGKWVHDTITPGLLTWTEDIQIKLTADPRTYIIRQGSKSLADEEVMYIPMERNLPFNVTDENVSWINGQTYVNTIGGAVGLFANLSKGDYIKKANDTIDKWIRVEEFYDAINLGGSTTTAANARSVRLGSTYLGVTGSEKGRYDKGVYIPADINVSARNQAAIGLAGGQFHWLALRSDTIENIGSAVTTSLSLAIDQHDGSTARVTSTAHGLVDGDRITISGTTNFDGTHTVEVETANIFYINVSGGPFADESGNGFYATVTTVARSTPYGLQEESANHGFNSNDTITLDGTTNYDGQYLINVRSSTVFTVPMPAAAATETVGTATLARVIVRTEGAVAQIIQGQVIDIGGSVADNIRQYVGMASLSETAPTYSVPTGYNTLDGMANWNGTINESLTARVSKLSSMMADKAQDKMVRALPSAGITAINNTTNGSAQEITFTPPGGSLAIITPGSDGQCFVALPGSAPGISLLVNQLAYVEIDRNNPTTGTIVVANIDEAPVDENVFLVAVRLAGPEVYLWEGSIIATGSVPGPGFNATIVKQNQMLKLVEGGTWSWDLATETLTWDASAFVQIPQLANSVNSIAAGSAVLNAGEVAYVLINRVSPGGALTVNIATNASLVPTTDMFILARRENNDVVVGLHSMRLVSGESKKLYAGASNETLSALGLSTEADKGMLRILKQVGAASKRVIISPIDTVVFDGTTFGNEISGLRMKFDGIQVDLQTGQYYGYGDGTLAGSGALIGSAFTPATFTSPNLYRWYSVNFVADSLNADGTMNVKPLILAGADGSSSSLAVKAPFSSKKIGQVLVEATGTGSIINVVDQADIVQLATGAGGGGGTSPKLIGGGTFAWDLGTTALSFTSDIFVEQARLDYADNTIDQATVSPIILPTVNHVAYIDRLNASSGGADLTVLVDLITNVKDGQIIIARRDGNDVIVGSTSTRLRDGEEAKLFANRSNFTNQDNALKLIEGGTWSYTGGTPSVPAVVINSLNSVGSENPPSSGPGDGNTDSYGQAFTPLLSNTVGSVTVRMSNTFNTPYNIVARIYQTNGSSVPTGAALGISTAIVGAGIFGPQDLTFTFSTPVSVTGGQQYAFVISETLYAFGDRLSNHLVSDATGNDKVCFSLNGLVTFGSNAALKMSKWSVDSVAVVGVDPVIAWSDDAYIQVPSLAKTRNTIPAASLSLPYDHVAYVNLNRTAGVAANLTVNTVDEASAILTDDMVIIARNSGDDVVVGTNSMRLIPGESKALDAGVSNELLNVIPAASNADYTGQLRLLQNTVTPKRVNVSAVSKIVPDGTEYGIQLKNLLLEFGGAQIDFGTGSIYAEDGITALGIDFTPATIAASQYRWYSVTLIPSGVTGTNKINGQLVIIPATADGASAALAPKAAFASTGIKLGQVVVQESAGDIANITQANITQLTATGGSDGAGDANELVERLKGRLVEAPFEWVDSNVFLQTEDDKIASATATFDVANTLYKFTAPSQNIVSIQSLDPEFLTEEKDVDSVELMAFWNPGKIDGNATYEVTRNGGVNWSTMTMTRLGSTTETFRGIYKFPQDTSWIMLHEWAVANATAYRELNTTTLQAVAQKFVVSTQEVLQQAVLYINKVGSPVGSTKVQLVRDDGTGKPSTDLLDIIAEKAVTNSTLAAGDNAITLTWGTNVVPADDYHYVIVTDPAYKAGFSAGVNSVRARADITVPIGPFGINELNAGVWTANAAQSLIYTINGRPLDLRVRITSSAADVELKGYGLFYSRQDQVQTGLKNREVQQFDGTIDNENEFTITNFLPDPDLLKIYHVQTGQVYVHGIDGFSLDGHKVVFPVNTFNGLGSVTLVFNQLEGTSFDNSDSNAALLAANFLGSTDANIDRSQNGRGIFLRRPDGTLREITIDNTDSIVVYSV